MYKSLNTKVFVLLLLTSILTVACFPEVKESPTKSVDYSATADDILDKYRLVNEMKIDSLLALTSSSNTNYRYLVAHTLASQTKHPSALDSLYKLLDDSNIDVKTAAAYAIGQYKSKADAGKLVGAFISNDSLHRYDTYNATLLEAIGKTGDKSLLNHIATVSTYSLRDVDLLMGQARAMLQFTLRDVHSPEGDRLIGDATLDKVYPRKVREVYANALKRRKTIDIIPNKHRLLRTMTSDPSPNIRMVLAEKVSTIDDSEIQKAYLDHLDEEVDYRVKVNMIKGLSNLPYITAVEKVIKLLDDDNEHISLAAAQYLYRSGNASDASIYQSFIKPDMSHDVKHTIYAAILRHLPDYFTNSKQKIVNDLQASIDGTSDVYAQRSALLALGGDPKSFTALTTMRVNRDAPVIQSAIAESIRSMLTADKLTKSYRGNSLRAYKRMVADTLLSHLRKGDSGTLATIGSIFADPKMNWREMNVDVTDLEAAILDLSIPEDIEAHEQLLRAVSNITGRSYIPPNDYKYSSIDWAMMKNYGDTISAVIQTDLGNIHIALNPRSAPITVANFCHLTHTKYYNNKDITRVVPGFVVQAGCSRGDGYGTLNYCIPSELHPARYEDEGYIGMASAGKNTESAQWFITTAPAMHLNGSYTIFGKVTKGMDVVHKLKVGSKIKNIIITKYG